MSGQSYKLKYFPVAALGEPIRFLLSYAGKDFEDIRVHISQWGAVKPTTPLGKMPVLEMDGKVLYQTKAILRYLAKQAHLNGADDWEALQIDIAVDTIDDLRLAIRDYFYDSNDASRAAKRVQLDTGVLPLYLDRLDDQVSKNGGYLANGKLSWADIYFVSMADYFAEMAEMDNLIAKHRNLKALYDKVFALPKIAAYVARRPPTQKLVNYTKK